MKFCIVCGQSKTVSRHLYGIPKDENVREEWISSIGQFLPPCGWVCSDHFTEDCLGALRLRPGSLPSKHPCKINEEKLSNSNSFQEASASPCTLPEIMNENAYPQSPEPEPVLENETLFDKLIKTDLSSHPIPYLWGIHKTDHAVIFSKLLIGDIVFIEHLLLISRDEIRVQVKDKSMKIDGTIETIADLLEYISFIENSRVCDGKSGSCDIFLDYKKQLCKPCSSYKYFLRKSADKKRNSMILKKNKTKHLIYIKKQNRHFKKVITNLKNEKTDEHKLELFTKNLPTAQQEMIKACHRAAKTKNTGNRYTLDWVYECILMKIKSTRLYNHMRDNKILSLPAPSTISRYIRSIDGTFGFKSEVFEMIKEKTKHYEEWQRHGCLLIDECKITATKKFDKNSMEFIGFVDLGSFTPKNQEHTLGDHALVVMFQPFAGHGLQALGCFLTKGNITGEIQAKIILECIILCENSGLRIDVVTSDGATWNRTMWKHLGIQNPLEPWCEHPMDANRKLRMCSDFPHLIKCLRNNLEKKKAFQVPEGIVQYSYFEQLQKYESTKEFRIAFKLTPSHIHPKCGEKMCTRLAFQLFSNTTALALETYKDKISLFSNADATIAFCKRINQLIDLMNSSSPLTGLRYQSDKYNELADFLKYLDLWEQCSSSDIFLSKSTFDGLRATISCTLDLSEYLSKLGFRYFMTTRINQDHLEHFFGMMRTAGGSNSHPESIQVGYIFRLMSLHSLIKPPRGSNVRGGEMIRSLLKVGELKPQRKTFVFDLQLHEGISEVEEEFVEVEEAFAYFCGYVTRKIKSTTECILCKQSITGEGNEIFNSYIKNKSRGFLSFPSEHIINLLMEVEKAVSSVFETELTRNALSIILDKLSNFSPSKLLGCQIHKNIFTVGIIKTYILCRLSICCSKEQKKRKSESKTKYYAKMAKLQ